MAGFLLQIFILKLFYIYQRKLWISPQHELKQSPQNCNRKKKKWQKILRKTTMSLNHLKVSK